MACTVRLEDCRAVQQECTMSASRTSADHDQGRSNAILGRGTDSAQSRRPTLRPWTKTQFLPPRPVFLDEATGDQRAVYLEQVLLVKRNQALIARLRVTQRRPDHHLAAGVVVETTPGAEAPGVGDLVTR